jgi:hypothetical protein
MGNLVLIMCMRSSSHGTIIPLIGLFTVPTYQIHFGFLTPIFQVVV